MVVVVIISVLSLIAIPSYQKYKFKARQSEAKHLLATFYTHEKLFITNYGYGAVNFFQLGINLKGNFHYNVGWGSRNVSVYGSHPINKYKRDDINNEAVVTVPYRGPLVPETINGLTANYVNMTSMYSHCKVPFYTNRPRVRHSKCFLINGRLKRDNGNNNGDINDDIQVPATVSGSQLGEANARDVNVKVNGYRDVEFVIGAATKLKSKDEWIMTDKKRMINIRPGIE